MTTETRTFQGITYANGSCPASILAPLDGDNWGNETAYLRKDAAASWNRARAEVLAKTGIVLTVRGWNRTLVEQEQFFHERYVKGLASADQRYHVHAGTGAWYGLRKGSAAAAIPGDSNHGWGLAVDVVDFGNVGNFNHPRRTATIAILKRHGWTDDEGRSRIQEPWHLVYDPARDTQKNATPTPTGGFMADLTEKEQKELKEKVDKIHGLLTAPIKDGKGAAEPRAISERTLNAVRRVLANQLAAEAVPVEVDVDADDVADALVERLQALFKTLPNDTARAVADTIYARLAK